MAQTCGRTDERWRASRWARPGETLTRYPYILVLGQDDNERIMGARLARLGPRRRVEHRARRARTGRVRRDRDAEAARTARLRKVTAAWVGGCDGARSAVRELTGIAFPGAPYEHVFFVADTEVTGNMVPDEVNVYLWRAGFHLFFPDARRRITGGSSASCPRSCATGTTSRSTTWCRRCAPRRAPRSRSGNARGSPPIASRIAAPSAFAAAVASCWAMRRTSTARSARKA